MGQKYYCEKILNFFCTKYSVLFPGGGVYFSPTNGTGGYVDTGRLLYKLAKEANDAGDYFPVWGTCLGFELMMYLDADGGVDPRATCGAWNVVEKLKFTKGKYFENWKTLGKKTT